METIFRLPFLAFLVTFSLAYMFNFKSEEQQEVLLVIGQKCYHLHHWLIFSTIIIGGYILSYIPREALNVIVAGTVGFILEGLLYKDFLNISEDCEKAFVLSKTAHVQYMK